MHTGKLQMPLPPIICTPCGDKCPICTGAWEKIFRKVDKAQVILFLESETFSKKVHTLEVKGDNVVDLLWKGEEKWRLEEIYRRKSLDRFNIVGLFLQLVGTKILELHNTSRGLTWSLGRSPHPNHKREKILNYKVDSNWAGIHTF